MNKILFSVFCIYITLCFSLYICICNDVKVIENRFSPPWRSCLFIRDLISSSDFGKKSNKLRPDLSTLFIYKFGSEYALISEAVSAIHGDIIDDCDFFPQDHLQSDSPFHIPFEHKSLNEFRDLKYGIGNIFKIDDTYLLKLGNSREPDNQMLFFPRIKHFRRKLPVLPPEPYQRLMTFAIEVCMMPKLWYLELIHCMFMGMAPFFKGMLMSYSLQDVVGSALMTVGYLDSNFSMENCYRAVSMVSDNNISPNYEYICDKMKACLESGVFENGEYARFKTEFEKRIEENYKPAQNTDIELLNLPNFYLKMGISSSPFSGGYTKNHNVRTFYPVRVMVSMISIVSIAKSFSSILSVIALNFDTFNTFFSYTPLISIDKYFKYCRRFLRTNVKLNHRIHGYLIECLCKDFMSVGFIDESFNVIGSDREKFIQATMPSRVLSKGYGSVVPSMLVDEEIENIDTEWLDFTPDEDEITEAPLPRPATHRFYKSKLFSKTKRKGVKDTRFVRTGKSGTRKVGTRIKSLGNKLTTVMFPKKFSRAYIINECEE
ncbi:hypothetical protein FG386_002212 [Cryptosporidium ryanae]|uniref:uncharacterized protein n=1 Tax=Cryptosporidium ryanae TaxID=515981 RepID=UPI00351A9ACD|nr:hypothetical protein FG386_002212 [Cryptosporidium ryanae]